ncbi:MAG: PhnD/SsuA/transferrin family substrate-binding protein [Erysipelothrix sp.]|nr:PhnD/SsuA/transferrin family substrate-binding protein [Erysipelothrix sp.]
MKGVILYIIIVMLMSACTPMQKQNEIKELIIYGFPFLEPEVMLSRSEPLKNLLKEELSLRGYNIETVSIYIGTSQNAVAEALSSGSAQIGFLNSLTYLLYEEEDLIPLLSALRGKLNIDSERISDWNTLTPIVRYTDQLDSTYRNVILAGPSIKGQSLISQLNDDMPLSWEEISTAKWCMPNPGNAGYIYGALWVYQTYGKSMSELPNLTIMGGYHEMIQSMATLQCDVASMPMILRRDYQTRWQTDFNRSASFLEEVKVIGLPPRTPNSLIVVNKAALNNDEELINAIKNSFLAIIKTEEGKLAISPFSVDGLSEVPDNLFDADLAAIELLGLGRP